MEAQFWFMSIFFAASVGYFLGRVEAFTFRVKGVTDPIREAWHNKKPRRIDRA